MILHECQTCYIRVATKPANHECPVCGHRDFKVMIPCDCRHYEYPSFVRHSRNGHDMCHDCYENQRGMALDLQESL
jgi:hypothetical protein